MMAREKTKKITFRLNYRHESQKGYQALFEIRNYTDKPFRINVYDKNSKIIHLNKENIEKGTVINHPREEILNKYIGYLKNRCKDTLQFLEYNRIKINKKNVEEFLYNRYSDVISYYEYVEDEEEANEFYEYLQKTPEDLKKEEEEKRKREMELGIYKPQSILEILKYHKPKKFGTKLHSIISFYFKIEGINDLHYSYFNKKFLDKIIWHCIKNGYQKNKKGEIGRYRYTTIFNITKLLKKFGKYMTNELKLNINQDYKEFVIKVGTDDAHIKYKWNDKYNIYTLYHDEFKVIENADFSNVKNKEERERYEKARLMFLVQTYAGGLRVSELFQMDKNSIIEMNNESRILLSSSKTHKLINNPVNRKLKLILKKYNNSIPRFENEQDYNDALKKMALYLKLDREILQYDDYAHIDYPSWHKRELYALFTTKLARKALVSILYNADENINHIARITNHSEKTIEYYIQLEDNYKRQMLDKL